MLSQCCFRLSLNIALGYVASTDDSTFIHSYQVGWSFTPDSSAGVLFFYYGPLRQSKAKQNKFL